MKKWPRHATPSLRISFRAAIHQRDILLFALILTLERESGWWPSGSLFASDASCILTWRESQGAERNQGPSALRGPPLHQSGSERRLVWLSHEIHPPRPQTNMQQLEKNLPSDLGAATQRETPQSDASQLASEWEPKQPNTFFTN